MKNKGFTLIELLAILAILAIILLIAIPSVLNIIEDSKRSAFVSSSLLITKAAEETIISSDGKTKIIDIETLKKDVSFSDKFTGEIVLVNYNNGKFEYYVTITDGTYFFCETIREEVKVSNIKLAKTDTCNNKTINLTHTLSPSDWTKDNVDILLSLIDTENSDFEYILLPNDEKIRETTTSYTVSSNGTYTFKLKLNNSPIEKEYDVLVSNIDKIKPDITLKPTSSDVNELTVTVTASDTQSGVLKILLPDSTIINGDNITFKITENGTYTFKAIDNVGNESVEELTITDLDNTPPVLTLTKNPNTWTNTSVVINSSSPDSDLDYILLPDNSKGTSYTASNNGTYTFKAYDKSGNMATQSIDITNIDKVDPNISYNITPSVWTNGNVIINVTTSDTLSGVNYIETPTLNKVYAAATSFTATTNGTYTFKVYDKVGNSKVLNIVISNIDKISPTLTLRQDITEISDKNVVITYTANDAQSGVKEITFPDNTIVTTSNGTYTVSGNGTYVFKVVDNVGNVTTQSIEITNIDRPFITKWKTTNVNQIIELPFSDEYNYDIIVDWGDGVVETYTTHNVSHTYASAGEYVIKISGTMPYFVSTPNNTMTNIIDFGEVYVKKLKFGGYHNDYCKNLTGTIPNPRQYSFENITSFDYLFNNCKNLTGSIPEDLFKSATNITSFVATFDGATGLTGAIPENLFANNPNVTSLLSTFDGASGLTGSIPENLFANNPLVTSFAYTFSEASGLTGTIPENLFANNPNVIDLYYTFDGATGLTGAIPENLFANNPNVTRFWGIFRRASGLTGEIPENLFANNPLITSFAYTFFEATGLTGSIPVNLFKNNPNVRDFDFTFSRATGLTETIPVNLFKNNPNVTSFKGTFYEATGLTGSIPVNLFKNNPNVTSFESTFFGATGLTGAIPENLFANNPNVTRFWGTFSGASGLTGNAPELWNTHTKVTSSTGCFKGLTNLTNYSSIPSNWK